MAYLKNVDNFEMSAKHGNFWLGVQLSLNVMIMEFKYANSLLLVKTE